MNKQEVFEFIKQNVSILKQKKEKPIRIAINGIEGTGKTVFTEQLTVYFNTNKVKAIQVSIDGFHFNKETR